MFIQEGFVGWTIPARWVKPGKMYPFIIIVKKNVIVRVLGEIGFASLLGDSIENNVGTFLTSLLAPHLPRDA